MCALTKQLVKTKVGLHKRVNVIASLCLYTASFSNACISSRSNSLCYAAPTSTTAHSIARRATQISWTRKLRGLQGAWSCTGIVTAPFCCCCAKNVPTPWRTSTTPRVRGSGGPPGARCGWP